MASTAYPHYHQPPCAFFIDAIRLSGARNVTVVSEVFEGEGAHPCTSAILNEFPFARAAPVGMKTAVQVLLGARVLIFGRSSFPFATSKIAATPLCFTFDWSSFNWCMQEMPPHFDAAPSDEYRRVFANGWTKTDEQVNEIRTGVIGEWSFVDGPSVRKTLVSNGTLVPAGQ